MKTLEFFFDFGSPYSYLSNTQLPRLIAGKDVELVYRPAGILRLMELAGNRPTTLESKNKRRYAAADLGRWAQHYGVRWERNPYLKHMKLEPLLQGALVAIEHGVADIYVAAIFNAIYSDALNLDDDQTYVQVLNDAGLDGAAICKARDTEALAAEVARRTEEAVERGLFGMPTFIVDDQLYFGNDRLLFVEEALSA